MKVTRFVKVLEDGSTQDVWVTTRKDGQGEVVSVAIKCEDETFNPTTGFIQEEKFMYWIKGASIEVVERGVKALLAQIQKGIFVPYRVFSDTPMHDSHQPDVNPSTGVAMDRYSQVRLGSAEQARTLHRTYVEVSIQSEETTDSKEEAVTVETGAEETVK